LTARKRALAAAVGEHLDVAVHLRLMRMSPEESRLSIRTLPRHTVDVDVAGAVEQ